MKKNLFFIFLAGALVLPKSVLAIACTGGVTITNMVCNVANTVWIVATGIVLIFWIITGLLFLTAMGDPTKLATARKALIASVAGTVLVILAYSALEIIGNAILLGV